MGGIESASAFQFESYKIDTVHLEMRRIVSLLEFRGYFDPDSINLQIGIREPTYFKTKILEPLNTAFYAELISSGVYCRGEWDISLAHDEQIVSKTLDAPKSL